MAPVLRRHWAPRGKATIVLLQRGEHHQTVSGDRRSCGRAAAGGVDFRLRVPHADIPPSRSSPSLASYGRAELNGPWLRGIAECASRFV